MNNYKYIKSAIDDQIGILHLDRPDILNAISLGLLSELVDALGVFENDDNIRCIIITGNEKAFSAGADIKEMASASPMGMRDLYRHDKWKRLGEITKPMIAAVSGYAMGGGCELAMCCDIIVASETARFGQPEINIGIIPGAGGTQRLTRTLGKFRAMEIILTGKSISAVEALDMGLVNRVAPQTQYMEEAMKIARNISRKPPVAVRLAKEAVLKAWNSLLDNGLEHERNLFYLLFSTEDQKEGMRAFMEKRGPEFKGR